ncbi:hypothetical protein [Pantoea agglomerans]|uniref:hypothetical protein n=1 Tax=Enterobacter agglomerans TaxID=549 RepID=UPI003C7D1FAB
MKIKRRTVWTLLCLFCALFWILIFSFFNHALAADQHHKKSRSYGDVPPEKLVQKIKRLDLTEQQRKFLESVLQNEGARDEKK